MSAAVLATRFFLGFLLHLFRKLHRFVSCTTLLFSHLLERFGWKRVDTTTLFFEFRPSRFEFGDRLSLLPVCFLSFAGTKFLLSLTLMFLSLL